MHRVSQRRSNRDALLTLLSTNQIDRRQFLKAFGGASAFALLGPTLLAACGGGDGGDGESLAVDNWILYIDKDADGNIPTITAFEEESGLSVTYTEGVNSNEEWFAKYQPQFAAGQSIGIDVVMLTNYMASKMIQLGYVEELDKANIPNASNLAPAWQGAGFDPDRSYTMPWLSFMTIVGYDIDQTGGEITSFEDLFDPAFAGKIGMFDNYADTLPFFLLMEGKDPATASVDDYVAATQPMKEMIDSGQVRSLYGNDYIDALLNGDTFISLAYSGDILSSSPDKPSLRYSFPDDGFVLGTDNMLIPKGAANKEGAEAWINFYYQPEIAAQVSAGAFYPSPVEGVREAAEAIDPTLLENTLIFPPEDVMAKAYAVRAFTEEEENAVNEAFAAAAGL
jgi:spermidine/putrescine transport system substrate-binding protein